MVNLSRGTIYSLKVLFYTSATGHNWKSGIFIAVFWEPLISILIMLSAQFR